jgi:hypothetical protein
MWCGHLEDTSQPRLDPYDATEDIEAIASDTAYNDGEWHHIVYWHDPDSGSAIYLDGEQVASTDEAVASPASSNDLAIGSKSNEADYYSGDLADVRLYGEALSEEQVAALFEGTSGGGDDTPPPTEFQVEAIAPSYYDDLEEGQEAPGALPGEEVTVELDLTEYVGTGAVQLRFEDYWPSDGWGALVYNGTISADGEEVVSFDAHSNDGQYIVDDSGSNTDIDGQRFADANSYWVYEFEIPADASSATATLAMANGFRVLARASESGGN